MNGVSICECLEGHLQSTLSRCPAAKFQMEGGGYYYFFFVVAWITLSDLLGGCHKPKICVVILSVILLEGWNQIMFSLLKHTALMEKCKYA